MGQYLGIGLIDKVIIEKSAVDKAGLSMEKLQEKMTQEFYYAPELYDINQVENELYCFQLKQTVITEQLIPFLKTIYPLLYDNPENYQTLVEKLQTLPASEWFSWAEKNSEEVFQFDKYGATDYLQIDFTTIRINYNAIMLSLEGKIIMETYGRQFNFFKYTLMETFKQFSLAKALRVYITG